MRSLLIPVFLFCCIPFSVYAAPCQSEDFKTFVSGKEQCLVIRRFGTERPNAMVVWLHGDVSSGGPANYHFPSAKSFAEENGSENILSVALVRPGYPDGEGNWSSVSFFNTGRQDHYTTKNITEVAVAIERLKDRFKPNRVILVGHSGGAATSALVLGLFPKLAHGAVLIACPCDLATWRKGRRSWPLSEDPIKWAPSVSPQSFVYALTGEQDSNTTPQLAKSYVAALKEVGVTAEFQLLENEGHNGAFNSPAVFLALQKLINHTPQHRTPAELPQSSGP